MSLYCLISGYGPFLDVTHNPADELGKVIASNFGNTFEGLKIKLLDYVSLEVTGKAVDELCQKWGQLINGIRTKEPNSKFLTINIGVNEGISERVMHYERFCFNSKCFDENSDLLDIDEIAFKDFPINQKFECKFDIEGIINSLRPYNPFVEINYDPGNYLCGYAFLSSSVKLANDKDTHSFFCHIPGGFDDLHFQSHTMLQFIMRYAGTYYPSLCFTTSSVVDVSELQNTQVYTKVSENQNQKISAATKGILKWRPVFYKAPNSRFPAGNVLCDAHCGDETMKTQLADSKDNSNFTWQEKLYEFVVITGDEDFGLDVIVDGQLAGKLKIEVIQLMEAGEIEEELQLSDENNECTDEMVKLYFTYERSWH